MRLAKRRMEVLDMARHNFVFFYGMVTKNPKIIYDEEGNFVRGQCVITTIRGSRNTEDDKYENYKYDCPILVTKNPELICKMTEWKTFDMVEIKGTVSTRDIKRGSICPNCGHQNIKAGVLCYITPIYVNKIEHGANEEECFNLLKEKCEISNQCIIAGNLCNDPIVYRPESGQMQAQYQIALNRKFRVKEDPPELKTDYPWVKSTGENAESDSKFLMKGSSVLVEGFVQTRNIKQKNVCEECGEEYEYTAQALEIVPYSTEYLLNCRSTEEIESMETAARESAFNDLFKTDN